MSNASNAPVNGNGQQPASLPRLGGQLPTHGSREKPLRVTQGQFFKLCVALQHNAKRFIEERICFGDACKALSVELGFLVGLRSLEDARNTTGVTWKPKSGPRKGSSPAAAHRSRAKAISALQAAVIHLYQKLGEPIPEGLVPLLQTSAEIDAASTP